MVPSLHVRQAVNHLNRVLAYYPIVQEGDQAEVALTPEDWQVVADVLFRMDTPREMLPAEIESFDWDEAMRQIRLRTADCLITVEMV
jgi:hypothetical protein